MSDMKKLLEAVDSMSKAEKKPEGPKFPGYWKGTDPASKAKSKMVGSAEESIIKDLHKTAKEKVTEWSLQEKYDKFKEQVFLYRPDEPTATPPRIEITGHGPDKPAAPVTKPVSPTTTSTAPVTPAPTKTRWQDIHATNPGIKNPNLIYPGQRIKLPNSDEDYVVQKGDNLSKIAKMYDRGDIGGRIVGGDTAPLTPGMKEESLEEQFARLMQDQDKEADYGPEYQAMVKRVGQRAKQGPTKTVWDEKTRRYKVVPVKDKTVREYENMQSPNDQITSPPDPDASASSQFAARAKELQNIEEYGNAQNPNQQATTQTSPNTADIKKAALDQQVDVATAKGTMSGLKSALGPGLDTNQAASAATKISDGKPLTGPEQRAISTLTPLVAKAAETPQTAMALKTALNNAALLAKQGK